MRIVCLSDTHSQHAQLEVPDGDVLVHAGDFTGRGERHEILEFHRWLATLPHQHKLVIAGNHDLMFENDPEQARALLNACTYLQDSGVTVDGIKFWGSPWQPLFYDWAFNLQRGPALAAKWALIPTDTDVLVTHGPPFGILDMTARGEPAGCHELACELARVRPRLHVFGHIHEAYGQLKRNGTTFVNACNCTLHYQPDNPAIVIDL
tara:strand:- start:693 stop:1313 length:621 start_codon:yes stop_codon:yes gene_type:complete